MLAQDYMLVPVVSAPFEENSYILHLAGRSDCLIIDPGFEPELIVQYVEQHGLQPAAILNTHGHADHIAGNAAMKQHWPDAPLVIGAGDAAMLTDPVSNLSLPFGLRVVSPPADRLVRAGERFEAAGIALEVLDVPGHTPGHVVYIWRAATPIVVFGGDVLFAGSIGRTDFPHSDTQLLLDGIRAKLFGLPDDTIVYPGHYGPTSIGMEKRHNPFVGGRWAV